MKYMKLKVASVCMIRTRGGTFRSLLRSWLTLRWSTLAFSLTRASKTSSLSPGPPPSNVWYDNIEGKKHSNTPQLFPPYPHLLALLSLPRAWHNIEVILCTSHADIPEADCVQQNCLPQQLKARSLLEARVLFQDSSQDQGGTGACGFYGDGLLQVGLLGMVVQDLFHLTFKSLVPLPKNIVVNQDEREVWEIERGRRSVSKQERGFIDAFLSQCCYLSHEFMELWKAMVYELTIIPTSSVLSEKSMEGMFSNGKECWKTTITVVIYVFGLCLLLRSCSMKGKAQWGDTRV